MPSPRVTEAKTLAQRAYEMLSRYIAQGRLRPGEQVLAKDLSNKLGMARTPVREALLRLQSVFLIAVTTAWLGRSGKVNVRQRTAEAGTFPAGVVTVTRACLGSQVVG